MIELKDVSYAYPSATGQSSESLSSISFELNPGDLVALVGANGAGKSTLGRVLCGTYVPREGKVLSDGVELEGEALHKLVGYVRQDPTSQLVAPTVFDEVAFGPCNLGLSEELVRERISWALAQVSLSGYEERLVSELSGGELQRLALAGVLACKPQYLVLDEVTSQLDGASREQLRSIIEKQVHGGTGIVLIAHDAIEVARASCVVLLEAGKVAWQGSPAAFFADAALVERACLRIPHVAQYAPETSKKIPVPELILEDVSVVFDDYSALSNVSLTAYQGQVLLIAGRSGSGKSTLANVCSGLLEPDAGTALLDGTSVQVGSVGLCMQRPEAQLFCDSVCDDVAFGPINNGMSEIEAHQRSKELLISFGIPEELFDTSPFALSGGQRRRVALAGIVALGTNVIIFDEPTVGLDAAGCAFLKDAIKRLAAEGKAVMVVSHDVDEWLDVAQSVALLEAGKLIWQGAPADLYQQAVMLEKAGLGVPVWEQMAAELARLGVSAKAGVAHER